jgi:hypothetical protein
MRCAAPRKDSNLRDSAGVCLLGIRFALRGTRPAPRGLLRCGPFVSRRSLNWVRALAHLMGDQPAGPVGAWSARSGR